MAGVSTDRETASQAAKVSRSAGVNSQQPETAIEIDRKNRIAEILAVRVAGGLYLIAVACQELFERKTRRPCRVDILRSG